MPRRARFLLSGVPHHVTQRGNRRERVFFEHEDRSTYLQLLRDQSARHEVDVVAYCLMSNHVHLVLIPTDSDKLHCVMRAIHGQYAQVVNKRRSQSGHVWQARYFSSPLDANYFFNAVRYVELNPVRAGLVARAENYQWSSAAVHCGLRDDPVVDAALRSSILSGIADWSRWLAAGIADESLETLRSRGSQNLPCGSTEFITELERATGRLLRYRRAGREPQKKEKKGDSHL